MPLLFRLRLGARSGILTDVSIMVMAKSCLYQTQHSGLTITANGHICHGTKMCDLSVCAACVFFMCVCVCLVFCICMACGFRRTQVSSLNKAKSQLVLLAELKIVLTDEERLHSPLNRSWVFRFLSLYREGLHPLIE